MTADWRHHYQKNTLSAQEAVRHIQRNNRVVVGHAAGEPSALLDAMVAQKELYQGVELVHMVPLGQAVYCQKDMAPHFRHNALFVGSATRAAVQEGRGDFTPCFFSEIPSFFDDTLPVDVALVTITPPDEQGICSLGVSVDYTLAAVKKAKQVIAQVNNTMPRTGGAALISIEEIDYFVQDSRPILQLAPSHIGAVEEAIGRNVASLIQDGDTLQLGIGAIPDAVLSCLSDKKDLGIHSEMFSDGVVALAEAGVINNQRKTIHKGKYIATFLMGSQRLYNFVHNNPEIEMYPVDYVNDPFVIAQNDNLVAINSCVQVDLMGQICSETIGATQISGTGGQVDFIRGAAKSKGGRGIIAMPSTTKKGQSKIVANLDHGAAVTTGRCDAHYIVTEYGIAKLKGKTLRQRAQALIAIAHPDAQEGLWEEFHRRFPL